MRYARAVHVDHQTALLTLGTLGFGAFGLWFFVAPEAIESMGVALESSQARVEIRAVYAGLELGLAAYLGVALWRQAWRRQALVAQTFALAGMGLVRLVGIAMEGQGSPLLWSLAALELGTACLGIMSLRARS